MLDLASRRLYKSMDGAEFCLLDIGDQLAMVKRGEVMPVIMSAPKEDPPKLVCFWCGDKFDLLLIGPIEYTDQREFEKSNANPQVQKMLIAGHTPCGDCREIMARGVCVLEIEGEGARTVDTGRYWLFGEYVVRKLISTPALLRRVLKTRYVLIDKEMATRLGLYDVATSGATM